MSAITGKSGSVTFTSGYTTNAFSWEIRPSAGVLDTTPFSPTEDYLTASAGILDWEGSYQCRQKAAATTTLSGTGAFVTNPYRYELEATCIPLENTPFTSTYRTRMAGLLLVRGSISAYIDTTEPLPIAGTTGTITFTVLTGTTAAVPIIVESVNVGVEAEGGSRTVVTNFRSTGSVTLTTLKGAGTTGAAVFVAETGRQYSGSILITSMRISLDASREEGDYTYAFVGAGAMTAA